MNEIQKKTAVIYARVSSTNDRQNTDRQFVDLRNYAAANGYTVVKEFDEHISGAAANDKRTVLNDCLNFAKENKIDMILCSELSRFSRNVEGLQNNVNMCIREHINVYFQKEGLTLLNDKGEKNDFIQLLTTLLVSFAERERELIYNRLQSGKKLYVARGGRLGRNKGSIKKASQYKEQYKDVIKLLKQGYSIRNVAKLCNVSTPTVQRVKKMFANDIAKGSN